MHLDFTQEQDDLRESIRSVLDRECPPALARGIVDGTPEGRARADALWATMASLDWPALTVPADAGGVGYGYVELGVLAEELGRAIAPGPLFTTVTQFVAAVREAGTPEQQKRFLGAVAAGEMTGTLAVAEGAGVWDAGAVTTKAVASGHHWVLHGEKRYVLGGAEADEIAVVASLGEGDVSHDVGLFVVPRADVEIVEVDSLDRSRPVATVRLEGVQVDGGRLLGGVGDAGPAIQRILEEATVALALEMLGTCQAIFDMNVAYANERQQFDRPIGSFQAVKHRLADGLIALERARACCYFAAACIGEDDPRRSLAASVAKAAAGDCQRYITREGIQLLGGIGYTWEHDMHLYVKRAKAGDALFGTASHHRERIAQMVSDRRVDHQGPRWTLDGR
ncbi:MAG TPA: acyl-CoA dehydrogenase family protein [Acidimicrobiia bacterium]|nr:acyl-CoA dehydrogenase family protein [Acidimicrobiia bacterium]